MNRQLITIGIVLVCCAGTANGQSTSDAQGLDGVIAAPGKVVLAPVAAPYDDGRRVEGNVGQVFPASVGMRSSGITVDVHASSAPNAFGSPSWSGYSANALYALENDLAMNVDRSVDPTGYERAPAQIPAGDIAVTSFKSWRGVLSPAAPFHDEYGNRLHFGMHAYGDGSTQFTLEDLTFELHSSDPGDSLVFVGDFIGFGYTGTTRYGIDWGPNRVKGGGDDTVYTSGNGTTLVDEIVYVGVGNAWWPSGGDPQTDMDDYFAWIASMGSVEVSCTYAILDATGSDSVEVSTPRITLEPNLDCYADGDTVTVEIWMHDQEEMIVGGQFFLEYDNSKLDWVSAAAGDSPFTDVLYSFVDEGLGTIDHIVNAPSGDPGVDGTHKLAVLTFEALAQLCVETDLITWRAHIPPSRLSNDVGGAVEPPMVNMDVIDEEAPDITCPADVIIECDESTDPSNTGEATATDNCDGSPTVTPSDVESNGTCPQQKSITRTWKAEDDCGNESTCVQTIKVRDTTDPVITCPADVTIECDESTDPDDTGVTVAMGFESNPAIGPTQSPGVWYTDRYAPFGFVSEFFDGDDRLKHSIDASDCSPCRPGGFGSAFYDTQGRKYDLAAGTTRMTIDLYVPAAWAATGRRMAGFWGTAFDSGAVISSFPIIEFTSDGGTPRFRGWISDPGAWTDMGLPTGFVYDAWYTLEIELVGNDFVYTVGDLQLVVDALGSVEIGNVILQGHNNTPGVTYDIYWDNFIASQTTIATDNCDTSPTVTYTDVPSLGGCNGTGTIARTWKAEDDCGNIATCVQTITVEDNTLPEFEFVPPDAIVECDESLIPSGLYGVATGGVAVYYNDNGGGENPANQAFLKAQIDGTNDPLGGVSGAPFLFSNAPLVGGSPFSWHLLYSGLVYPDSQFGLDFVMQALTNDGSVPTPVLNAYNNGNNTVAGRLLVGGVTWALNNYQPHSPDIGGGAVINSIVRSQSPGMPAVDVEITQLDLSQAGPIFTIDIAGKLVSTGTHYWYTIGQPDSPMSNFGLNGDFYFFGTLTYDSTGDPGTDLIDFYEGDIYLYANSPTTQLEYARATDNCDTLPYPLVDFDDDTSGLTGCSDTGTIIRTWSATDACGNVATVDQTITVVDTTPPVMTACPADITVPADAGGCDAVVTFNEPTATDNCDPAPVVVCDWPSGSTFPQGTTLVTCTATDECGKDSECSFNVTVENVNELAVTVQLSPNIDPTGTLTRCITFELWECGVPSLVTVDAEIDFTVTAGAPNVAIGSAVIDVPCGNYTCITARDTLHTLRRTDGSFPVFSGTQYVADFTGDPGTGGDWLIGGNLNDDNYIDILDFGVFSFQFGTSYGTGDTTCATAAPHSDISGDGNVNNLDFSFIQLNFLKFHEANCCGQPLRMADGSTDNGPVTSITVRELRNRGLGHLVVGDLNRDGVLNEQDIAAFADGVRPQPRPRPLDPAPMTPNVAPSQGK